MSKLITLGIVVAVTAEFGSQVGLILVSLLYFTR